MTLRRHSDPVFQSRVDHTRAEVMRTLRDIRAGYVNEDDVDKLQNFCLFALALMQMEGPKKWALAKMNAELMALMRERAPVSIHESIQGAT